MRISILPKSLLGWWSVGLVPALILFALLQGLFAHLTGYKFDPGTVGLMIFGAALAIPIIGILVTGILSIIKRKERSILVFSVLAINLFFLLFLPGFWIQNWGG